MLGDNIRKYRKLNNMSQDELAEKLNVTRQSISLWENGQTQPSLENIVALSKLFKVSTDELLESDKTDIPATNTATPQKPEDPKKKPNNLFLLVGIAAAVVVLLVVVGVFLWFVVWLLFWWCWVFNERCMWIVCMKTGSTCGSYKNSPFNVRAVSKF